MKTIDLTPFFLQSIPCDKISRETNTTSSTPFISPVSYYLCSICIDKGTIERECEFNNQYHKFSVNNAFVIIKLTVRVYVCVFFFLSK